MIKVVIVSTAVREMKGNSKTTGKPYHMAFQDAYFYTVAQNGEVAPFPQKVEVDVPKVNGQFPTNPDGSIVGLPTGDYTLSPSSVYVENGKMICRPALLPLKSQKPTPH